MYREMMSGALLLPYFTISRWAGKVGELPELYLSDYNASRGDTSGLFAQPKIAGFMSEWGWFDGSL